MMERSDYCRRKRTEMDSMFRGTGADQNAAREKEGVLVLQRSCAICVRTKPGNG